MKMWSCRQKAHTHVVVNDFTEVLKDAVGVWWATGGKIYQISQLFARLLAVGPLLGCTMDKASIEVGFFVIYWLWTLSLCVFCEVNLSWCYTRLWGEWKSEHYIFVPVHFWAAKKLDLRLYHIRWRFDQGISRCPWVSDLACREFWQLSLCRLFSCGAPFVGGS